MSSHKCGTEEEDEDDGHIHVVVWSDVQQFNFKCPSQSFVICILCCSPILSLVVSLFLPESLCLPDGINFY